MQKIIFIQIILLIQLIINVASTNNKPDEDAKLIGLVVFTRHGARAPAYEDYYKEEWGGLNKGDLTSRGILQLQDLGKFLRKTYPDFFKQEWDPNFQRVRIALNLQRTLLSMLSLFHGLYPDLYSNKSSLTHEELYHPHKDLGFPLKYDTETKDLIFRPISRANCKMADDLLRKYSNGAKFTVITNRFLDDPLMKSIKKKILEYRGEPQGDLELRDMYHVKEIFDSYLCNRNDNKRIPQFSMEEYNLLKQLYEMFFFRFYGVRKHRMLLVSAFYKEVYNFVEDIRKGNTLNRFFLFSGTKTNIAIIISSLLTKEQIKALGKDKIASLSTTFIVELYQKTQDGSIKLLGKEKHHHNNNNIPIPTNELFVKIKYANKELQLKQCKERVQCTYKEFIILLKTRIVPNLEQVCSHSILSS